jgi:phage terminase small subunit
MPRTADQSSEKPDKPLKGRRQRFVAEYLVDHNATAAYRRAGYKAKTDNVAAVESARLLRNPKIRAAIDAARKPILDSLQISAKSVLSELSRLAFSDMRRFASWGARGVTLTDSAALSDDDAACVLEVSESGGEETKVKIKLHSKLNALEKLGRHLGLWKEPSVEAVEKRLELLPRSLSDAIRGLVKQRLAGGPAAPDSVAR